jgi:hypothetical protein
MATHQFHATVRRILLPVLIAFAILHVAPARGQDLGRDGKVGGLPVGIVKDALGSPNAAKRQKLFALVKQRIARDAAARQKFLEADATAVGARLARFQYSVEMLTAARSETTDSALQAKIDEVIAAIQLARSAGQ